MGSPLIQSQILEGDRPRQKYVIGPPGGLNSTKHKRGPGPSPSSASDVVVVNSKALARAQRAPTEHCG